VGVHGGSKIKTTLLAVDIEDSYQFITLNGRFAEVELIREPEYVPLTVDDYNGEGVRVAGFTEVFWPLSASERGIVLNEDDGVESWERLARVYEYKKDDVWQPMRKVKQ
jgi:hypothetical protein